MHGLTGNQEPRSWRTEELLHVGDDLRRLREADQLSGTDDRHGPPPHRLRSWLGRHVIDLGRAVAGEPPRSPCPDLPQMGSQA